MGWSQGANTTFIDYLYFTKLLTAEGESGYSAGHYSLSVFWRFIP